METLNKGIFDSNVLTFLYSFLFLFFGGFLFYIETGAKKRIDDSKAHINEAEKKLNRLDIEQSTIELYTQIQMLRIFSTNVQTALISNEYRIDNRTNILTYEAFKMAEGILDELRDDQYKYITKGRKKVIDNIFEKMIYAFEKERILDNPNNKEKTQLVEKTIAKLEELQIKISRIKEINPDCEGK
jgi:hypothetical protein